MTRAAQVYAAQMIMEEVVPDTLQFNRLASRLSPEAECRCNEPLARRTTLRVGGPAQCYVEPASEGDLAAILEFAAGCGAPVTLLGRGSNLLIRDGGIRGIVVCLCKPAFGFITVAGEHLNCGAGARLKAVANEARRHGLAGLEFLEGIPGSIGGALRMNAGAMDACIFDRIVRVRVISRQGRIADLESSEIPVAYRSCPLLKEAIALGAVLRGTPDTTEAIQARMTAFSQKRWTSQPAASSAGCIFKNPPAIPAGRLIQELGLKGARVGAASVSDVHGNFLVNDGDATANDMLQLIDLVRRKAREERGIDLQTEVQILGEETLHEP
jgi:UDP-N-acetylenolpyruvoylglucosamine reductase